MIQIIACILVGVLFGYAFRGRSFMKRIGTLLSVVIGLLLFSLGLNVGSNEQVVNNFAIIGFDALLLTIGGVLGSLICAKWVYTRFFKKQHPAP